MSIISTVARTLVRVISKSGEAVCGIADVVADTTGTIGQLSAAAKDSATKYRKKVVETNNPTNPRVRANMELNEQLRIIVHRDYQHLPFLNEDNAAPVLKGVIGVLQEITKQQGKELHPMDWYLCYLAENNCNRKLNRIIAGAYQEYLSILAEAGSVGKGSKSSTSGSDINLIQRDPEMDELLDQQQAYQSQSYGDYDDSDYQPQPKAKAKPKAFSKRGNRAAAATSSEGVAQLAAAMGADIQNANKLGAAEGEETGSAGSESSSEKNQQ